MPFTLSHPAVVLPLLRRPFIPAALVAGAMTPDLPYFLSLLGLSTTSAQDWYGPLLPNATQTHSPWGLLINLPFALLLVVVFRMLREPITALLPAGFGLPQPERCPGHALWLLVSALIGVASHLVWDALTVSPLLQNGSTAVGLVAISWYLWHRRSRLRTEDGSILRLGTAARWSVVTALVAIPVLGIAVQARDDYTAFATVSEVDYSHTITVDRGNGVTETSYPTTTVPAPWYTVVEGMATGAAKRAGASFVVVLLLYAIGRHIIRRTRR
ncbi:DUF4184 family protein [Allokutzneria albata]|uniref:Uncharacterized protein n=1 Tax=Allokutzneria albata TaxID=211114 RepID=A0A1G9VB53_ALLAB|nr:DUF4184 family protein [Allokutzneria albata]SDM69095.1 protein of unknown function [Allokutzneria albata]